MILSIYNLLEASLLVINAIVVLNEERFLSKSIYYLDYYSLIFERMFLLID